MIELCKEKTEVITAIYDAKEESIVVYCNKNVFENNKTDFHMNT